MKLIVGLGNPGKEYEYTRHNIGFGIIDSFAKKNNLFIDKSKFNGLYNEFMFNNEKIILLKPLSFMNLSGEVVKKYVDFFKISIDDILIINDDLDLPFLKIKFKDHGSSGGHNGLKNIELNLKTNLYKRFKVGIANDKTIDTKNYVLSKLSATDIKKFDNFCEYACDVLFDYLSLPFNMLMNKYN